VVVARAAHTLAEHIAWREVGEFAAVFGLIWLAWLNGTTYYDLHGREEGRTRTFVFIQMMLLALLAVFTADAAGDGGARGSPSSSHCSWWCSAGCGTRCAGRIPRSTGLSPLAI
jgi:hypothetical protein